MIILSTRKRKTYTAAATEELTTEMVNKEEPAVVECHTYTDESVEPTSGFETIVESEPVEPAVESEPELDIVPEVEEKLKPIKTVKPKINALRAHSAPSMESECTKVINSIYYDIYKEQDGWGMLEDGSWILLSFTNKIR